MYMINLILASSSPFRRELLTRLGLPFACVAPELDETPLAEETPQALVRRLAEGKARAVAVRHSDALIIGSDQVAVLDNKIIGKPGDHARAVEQLRAASGQRVEFFTGLCLFDTFTGQVQVEVVPYAVVFRTLSEDLIENYLRREQPYHCAGAFRAEALGIVLFERLEGDDPNALIGLPLIRLVRMLEKFGINFLN
ncbi:m(7)GTP pyrophosphatase [Gammaproteobacteria bacterium]